MSVIIKGMDMPKNEELWIRVQPDGNIVSQTGYVIEDASAKQVPPHGRLIDANALISKVPDAVAYDEYGEEYYLGYTEDMIQREPTIIEAEVKE